jgi:hypothetical protein
LLDALVTSRVILALLAQATKKIKIDYCLIFFRAKNGKKKQIKCQAIVLDLQNYIFTFHSNNFHTNVVNPYLHPSSQQPIVEPLPF